MTQTTSKPSTGQTDKKKKAKRSATDKQSAKELERLVLSRGIRIIDNPVLTWMASSVCVQRDPADNIKPVKRARKNRIDGIVALIMALARATLREQTTSVYATRGVIHL